MKTSTIFGIAVVMGGLLLWWWSSPPNSDKIIQEMVVSADSINYDGIDYKLEWGEEAKEYSGDVRAIHEVYNKFAPFNTHQVLITTGDFSDPNKVRIEEQQVEVTLKGDLDGDVTIFHLVPQGFAGLQRLRQLKVGQKITINGKEEKDGEVKASDGGYIRFGTNGKGRPLVLVDSIDVL